MYTYGFLHTPTTPLTLPMGILAPVEIFTGKNLSAIVEPGVSVSALQQDDQQLMQAVLAHDHVLCELFRQTPLLPLRFGTDFGECDRLERYLKLHEGEYLQKLQALAGQAEYALKLVALEPTVLPISETLKGKDYFLAKKERYQNQQDFYQQQAAQRQTLRTMIMESYPQAVFAAAAENWQKVYFLERQPQEPILVQRVQLWQTACPHWELQLGGALPPYHFV